MTNKLFSSSHKCFLGPVQQMKEATQELEGTSMAGERTRGDQWGSGCAPQCRCNCSSPYCFHCYSALSWSPAHPTTSWDHINITTFEPCEFVWPPPLFAPKICPEPAPPLPSNRLWEIKEVTHYQKICFNCHQLTCRLIPSYYPFYLQFNSKQLFRHSNCAKFTVTVHWS